MSKANEQTRRAGAAIPLSAIRTNQGWCVGEYADLVPFASFCKEAGLSIVQLLPINDSGRQSSPYAALSAFALHPLYLRVSELPDPLGRDRAQAQLDVYAKTQRGNGFFDYYEAYDIKMAALRTVYDANCASILNSSEFRDFIRDNPWIKTYAVYKYLKVLNGDKSWRDWTAYTYPTKAAIESLWQDPARQAEQGYFVWLQLRCAQQLLSATDTLKKMKMELLGDLPILLNDDSADVWAERQLFRMDVRAGAPPEHDSDLGQNWGFPIYNWAKLANTDYAFWRERVQAAAHYYSAYRIDHVLGFFRIWAINEHEADGYCGYFVPGNPITREQLKTSGFADDRLRWLSQPHVQGAALRAVLEPHGLSIDSLRLPAGSGPAGIKASQSEPLLQRIGNEDLYLFNPALSGTLQIKASGLPAEVENFLGHVWRDRCLLQLEADNFVPLWRYYSSTAWHSLSWDEKQTLERLIHAAAQANADRWREQGRKILSVLVESSTMLPCAEDLGAIPPCVPEVLGQLGIYGLRIPRWTRYYERAGAPWIPPQDYPALSVCAVSVHDTSTFRGWWELEDGREDFARMLLPELQTVPALLAPELQARLLQALSRSASHIFMAQLQDYTDLSPAYRSLNPATDRVNVPGTLQASNWTWRMPVTVETLRSDKQLLESIQLVSRRA